MSHIPTCHIHMVGGFYKAKKNRRDIVGVSDRILIAGVVDLPILYYTIVSIIQHIRPVGNRRIQRGWYLVTRGSRRALTV